MNLPSIFSCPQSNRLLHRHYFGGNMCSYLANYTRRGHLLYCKDKATQFDAVIYIHTQFNPMNYIIPFDKVSVIGSHCLQEQHCCSNPMVFQHHGRYRTVRMLD